MSTNTNTKTDDFRSQWVYVSELLKQKGYPENSILNFKIIGKFKSNRLKLLATVSNEGKELGKHLGMVLMSKKNNQYVLLSLKPFIPKSY
jgi:hypothetical protein